ncbi:SDR family oxidoreductase [Sporolactobacillus sp. THM7-4]|nr:SDR family oxidoreductase [Sporolactobacillus sp. THM7-4]
MPSAPEIEDENYVPSGKLKDKTAIITGGDSGIGQATAILFAKEGADVAITYYESEDDATATVKRIRELGRKGTAFKGDVGEEAFAKDVVERVKEEFGKIDILVNNAGEQHVMESIRDISASQLDRTFRTNIFSMFYFVKAALPYLPSGASIINTASINAYKGNPVLLDYTSTKGAIVSFTRALSQNKEILSKKIRVNGVAPGPIWTPLIPATFPESQLEKFGKKTPLGRAGQPCELAPAYLYLACKDSSYVTGQVIHVNGGTVVNG